MASGPFVKSFYAVRDGAGGTTKRCYVLRQPESATLSFRGSTNNQATAITLNNPNFFNIILPIPRSVRVRTAAARVVRVRWIAPPAGYVGNGEPLICVPRTDRFASWQVGDIGTYLGGSVELVAKYEFGI